MLVSVSVQLAPEDNFSLTPDEAATAVLAALGGDPADDLCTCTVTMPISTGEAGTRAPAP